MRAQQLSNPSGKTRLSGNSSQAMFGRSGKSNKNSVVSQASTSRTATAFTQNTRSIHQPQDESRLEEVMTEVVQEIITHDRDEPIMKSGAVSHNHKPSGSEVQLTMVAAAATAPNRVSDSAAPNSPPSRQSRVTQQSQSSPVNPPEPSTTRSLQVKTKQHSNLNNDETRKSSFKQVGHSRNKKSINLGNSPGRSGVKVGSFAENCKTQRELQKQSLPSTLDPSNPLAHTNSTKAKKQAVKERSTFAQKSTNQLALSHQHGLTTQVSKPLTFGKTQLTISQKPIKMYNTVQLSASSLRSAGGHQTVNQVSPRSKVTSRERFELGRSSPRTLVSRTSTGKASPSGKNSPPKSIQNSQDMIRRSRQQRINSGGRQINLELENDTPSQAVIEEIDMQVQAQVSPRAFDQTSPRQIIYNSSSNFIGQSSPMTACQSNPSLGNGFGGPEEAIRDDMIFHLRQQLEYEKRQHREMKRMFDDTIGAMEQQSRSAPAEDIALQTSKAVDKILNQGQLTQAALAEEIEKLKNQVKDLQQSEKDLQSQNQGLEKQLLHSQIRVKEAEAKEQVRVLQQDTEERRLKMQIEKLKDQVRDQENNAERMKTDHAQQVQDLTDQIDQERQRQAQESEDRFMAQITEIKHAHAREREALIQQKFAATQELQMIKIDHSELIRNTNFEEQRELVETISELQAEIQSLKVALVAQESNHEVQLGALKNEKEALDAKVAELEAALAAEKATKEALGSEMKAKNSQLESQLSQANKEKDKLYKSQMEQIQENLDSLKEQIASTNQSLIDQSIVVAQQEHHQQLNNQLIARLHSPDFHSSRQRRFDPLRMSSPKVPRRFANLNAERGQQMHSPPARGVSGQNGLRDRSGDPKAQQLTGSDLQQDLTQLMSNTAGEQTINLGPQTAGQALFNNTVGGNNAIGNQAGQNSFLLDPVFNDYYVEYVMLSKLQALTNNFTCQSCWQVLSFSRFFDDDHECLKRIDVSLPVDHHHQVRHSQIGQDSIEEFKETRAMIGPVGANDTSRFLNDELLDSAPAVDTFSASKPEPVPLGMPPRSNSAFVSRGSHQNLRQTAQAALTGQPVVVAEINLAGATSRNARAGGMNAAQNTVGAEGDSLQKMTTGSFQHATTAPVLETLLEQNQQAGSNQVVFPDTHQLQLQRRNTAQAVLITQQQQQHQQQHSQRQKVNAMQLDAYVIKIKEYRLRIEELEAELKKCKSENESLIDDLCDSKTKVAVLEESKAKLQMEVTKLRKAQIKKVVSPVQTAAVTPRNNQNQTLNVTVNSQSYGAFALGGKSDYSVKVQPALMKTISQRSRMQQDELDLMMRPPKRTPPKRENFVAQILQTDGATDQDKATPRRQNSSDDKLQKNKSQDRQLFRSPQSRMVPLSQKFSAFPTARPRSGLGGMPSTIQGPMTRNDGTDLSLQSSHAQLIGHSFNNLMGSHLNSSYHQNVRAGQPQTARQMPSHEENKLGTQLVEAVRQGQRQQTVAELGSSDGESCEISPDNDYNLQRREALGGRSINHPHDDNMVMETDAANISALNPLVTPGLADTSHQRVSLFEARSSGQQLPRSIYQQQQQVLQPSQLKQHSPTNEVLSRSHKIVKLNNPYDDISITRMRRLDDESPELPTGETRQTITPGMTKLKRPIQTKEESMQQSQNQIVHVKQAVPIRRLELNTKASKSPLIRSNALEVVRKHARSKPLEGPMSLDELEK